MSLNKRQKSRELRLDSFCSSLTIVRERMPFDMLFTTAIADVLHFRTHNFIFVENFKLRTPVESSHQP